VLLEYGGGLPRYLTAHRHLVRPGRNGAVVVNCNPFTLGHRFLIEQAAGQIDRLYVFVVREDRSAFPFAVRLRLVEEGVRDLPNVSVLDSSHYAVSAVTFPAYFLKNPDAAATVQMEIDLMLFGRHIAPFFHINRRFIGTEPYCRTTRRYGETMRRILPDCGIETVQLERLQAGDEVVSAWRVRDALRREAYETVRRLVPETTWRYLFADEARELREKLKAYDQRH
jgi:[citrate (pro-3S)-lyase] ligase